MTLLARAREWLVEPEASTFPDCGRPATPIPDRDTGSCPVVAVVGLVPACGATTLARALAATLARRTYSGVAVVACSDPDRGSALATRGATRLAERLGAPTRAVGRICLTGENADPLLAQVVPLVFDVGRPAAHAQLTIFVAPGNSEPALAELAARAHAGALTVVTGGGDPERWQHRAFLLLPQSRLGARRAAAGWEPGGSLGAAVNRLAEVACA